MARRTKLTDKTQKAFCEAIRLGMTIELSAGYAGIAVSTYYKWQTEADKGEPRQVEFIEAVKGAAAHGAAKCLIAIDKAAQEGSWQAAAWILERRHQYRREMITIEPIREEVEIVDPNTEEGRAAILEQLQQLPQDLILAALNVKAIS
jgi:hypothetical protein